ncbi:MAG TPA: hypothetical protein VF810_01480 [Patescibacteria group bacterium]
MENYKKVGLRKVPRGIRKQLLNKRGKTSDFDITTGETRSVVAFGERRGRFLAYDLTNTVGEQPRTILVFDCSTPEDAVAAVLGKVFETRRSVGNTAMDWGKYKSKPVENHV